MFWGAKTETRGLSKESLVEEEMNIIVLGDSQVGKTTLLEEYCGIRDSDTATDSTNGLDIHCKRIRQGNRTLSIVFHDFGGDIAQRLGQEFFIKDLVAKNLPKKETRLFSAIFVIFDCSAKHTLYQMKGWLQWFYYSAQEALGKASNSMNSSKIEKSLGDLPVIVIGNKIDLMSSEPFFYHEVGKLPHEQREKLSSFLDNAGRRLRNHLCMTDCENLLFTSSECNPYKLVEILDRVLISIDQTTSNAIMNEEFSICGMPLLKSIKGKAFKEEILNSSWFSGFKGLFSKKEEPSLPL